MTRVQYNNHPTPRLWVVGIGTQYPDHLLRPEDLDCLASTYYDTEREGVKKLLAINRKTGIQTRASVLDFKQGLGTGSDPPTIEDLDTHFRDVGVDLATRACEQALTEAGLGSRDITHSVAVTCTNQGNPGYNILVHEKLGLHPNVDHELLHGVGCAGGLSIMRVAAQMALAATARGRPARILTFACELCSPNVRSELAVAEESSAEDVCVAAALFSDAAAAFVLTNDLGRGDSKAAFELLTFDNALLPDTIHHMSYYVSPFGARTVLSRAIPPLTIKAADQMFHDLVPEYSVHFSKATLRASDFDWALHPGGDAIIEGVKRTMSLSDEHLQASRKIYRTRGNSSSATVLIVLDTIRKQISGREHVVATSFGPGLSIEMAMLRRCKGEDAAS